MLRTVMYGMLIAAGGLLAACSQKEVSFSRDVQPILNENCRECHTPGGAGFQASGLDVTSYQALMKGGKYGPLVIPGDAFTSTLNMLVEGRADPSLQMPHNRKKLSDQDIQILKDWVDQGAKNN
jgi:hypothetical protein